MTATRSRLQTLNSRSRLATASSTPEQTAESEQIAHLPGTVARPFLLSLHRTLLFLFSSLFLFYSTFSSSYSSASLFLTLPVHSVIRPWVIVKRIFDRKAGRTTARARDSAESRKDTSSTGRTKLRKDSREGGWGREREWEDWGKEKEREKSRLHHDRTIQRSAQPTRYPPTLAAAWTLNCSRVSGPSGSPWLRTCRETSTGSCGNIGDRRRRRVTRTWWVSGEFWRLEKSGWRRATDRREKKTKLVERLRGQDAAQGSHLNKRISESPLGLRNSGWTHSYRMDIWNGGCSEYKLFIFIYCFIFL